jgi:pumilio RNA-binding family
MQYMVRMSLRSACTCMGTSSVFVWRYGLNFLTTLSNTTCIILFGFNSSNNRCRIIQKAVQRIDQDEVCKLVSEFQDKVLLFIHDPNGNHVIQRCIQVMSAFPKQVANDDVVVDDDDCIKPEDDPNSSSTSSLSDQMQFIVDDIVENIEMLSTHRYGCRVVQRAVEHCEAAQKKAVLENIVACLDSLIVDHYGEEM